MNDEKSFTRINFQSKFLNDAKRLSLPRVLHRLDGLCVCVCVSTTIPLPLLFAATPAAATAVTVAVAAAILTTTTAAAVQSFKRVFFVIQFVLLPHSLCENEFERSTLRCALIEQIFWRKIKRKS